MARESKHRDGVPEDYPGRIVEFPDGYTHLVVMVIGVQGPADNVRNEFIERIADLARPHADRLERGECTDASGVATSIVMSYWSTKDSASQWWERADVNAFWQGLPLTGETGFFMERMTIPSERFNYAAGTEDRHGAAAVFPLAPSGTFGYWGAYRDRLPASATDPFESPLEQVTINEQVESRGRRLSVTVPDNVCYIREGQGWGNCEDDERAIWEQQMDGVIDTWVARLGDDPAATGCLSIRDCRELDADSHQSIERRTQIAFLLSLGHIEQAARTDSAHLAVHRAFVNMYRAPRFKPRMHVWVEVGVMKHDEVASEYVNCHPQTGLLPYFDVSEMSTT